MSVLSESVGVRINADDLAAVALAAQLASETAERVKILRRGKMYLVMPYDQYPKDKGWECIKVAYPPEQG